MTAPSVSRAHSRARHTRTQPFRILVASGGEPSSIGAIRVATSLARRRSASVHALIAATPFPHSLSTVLDATSPPVADEHARRGAIEQLRHQLALVRGTSEWAIRATTGFPAESILDAARRWPASIVIMGSGDHGLTSRLVGSEVSVTVARDSTIPVLVVPGNARDLPTKAVAAVDFSESSIAAASLAATLLGPNGTLTLLYASPLIVESGPTGTLTDLYTTGARDRLAEVASSIHRRTKRPVECAVASGGIVDRLHDFVERHDCDLITLGGHEPTLLERILVGRTRTQVLRDASCSVLVVPAAASEEG